MTGSWEAAVTRFVAEGQAVCALVDAAVETGFGVSARLRALLPGTAVTTISGFPPNPCWESFQRAVDTARCCGARDIVAIGGGTAIDLAKLTAMALRLGGAEEVWMAAAAGGELSGAGRSEIRVMAVPTTAGTGAEVTRFAVLYRDGIKHSVSGDALKPDAFALDPSLLATLPATVIADSGLDAACQAMESLWSVNGTRTRAAERHAWPALRLAVQHLGDAVRRRAEPSVAGMLVAAHLAGRAINLTTTTAPHALSYGLTSQLGIPHGRAVALLFGPLFHHTATAPPGHCTHPRGHGFLMRRLDAIARSWGQTRASFPAWWQACLTKSLPLPVPPCGIDERTMEALLNSVNATRLANHPVVLTAADIRNLYEQTLGRRPHSTP